ncbi:MAG TPA: hypothetical protein VGI96_36445, partial [Streptosporangiaceae bacterium]
SGLKYVGVPTYPLGFVMGAIAVIGAGYGLVRLRARRSAEGLAADAPAPALAGADPGEPPETAAAPGPLDDVPVR